MNQIGGFMVNHTLLNGIKYALRFIVIYIQFVRYSKLQTQFFAIIYKFRDIKKVFQISGLAF